LNFRVEFCQKLDNNSISFLDKKLNFIQMILAVAKFLRSYQSRGVSNYFRCGPYCAGYLLLARRPDFSKKVHFKLKNALSGPNVASGPYIAPTCLSQ